MPLVGYRIAAGVAMYVRVRLLRPRLENPGEAAVAGRAADIEAPLPVQADVVADLDRRISHTSAPTRSLCGRLRPWRW
jgi:hypothetical protein